MSWYLNLLFRLKMQSLIDHTWAKRGVSVCFHYLKVNTCNVYALYVVIVLVLNPFHTIFSLVTSLPYPLDIKSIFFNSNSTSMYIYMYIYIDGLFNLHLSRFRRSLRDLFCYC